MSAASARTWSGWNYTSAFSAGLRASTLVMKCSATAAAVTPRACTSALSALAVVIVSKVMLEAL